MDFLVIVLIIPSVFLFFKIIYVSIINAITVRKRATCISLSITYISKSADIKSIGNALYKLIFMKLFFKLCILGFF
jgi:hypothetical protein